MPLKAFHPSFAHPSSPDDLLLETSDNTLFFVDLNLLAPISSFFADLQSLPRPPHQYRVEAEHQPRLLDSHDPNETHNTGARDSGTLDLIGNDIDIPLLSNGTSEGLCLVLDVALHLNRPSTLAEREGLTRRCASPDSWSSSMSSRSSCGSRSRSRTRNRSRSRTCNDQQCFSPESAPSNPTKTSDPHPLPTFTPPREIATSIRDSLIFADAYGISDFPDLLLDFLSSPIVQAFYYGLEYGHEGGRHKSKSGVSNRQRAIFALVICLLAGIADDLDSAKDLSRATLLFDLHLDLGPDLKPVARPSLANGTKVKVSTDGMSGQAGTDRSNGNDNDNDDGTGACKVDRNDKSEMRTKGKGKARAMEEDADDDEAEDEDECRELPPAIKWLVAYNERAERLFRRIQMLNAVECPRLQQLRKDLQETRIPMKKHNCRLGKSSRALSTETERTVVGSFMAASSSSTTPYLNQNVQLENCPGQDSTGALRPTTSPNLQLLCAHRNADQSGLRARIAHRIIQALLTGKLGDPTWTADLRKYQLRSIVEQESKVWLASAIDERADGGRPDQIPTDSTTGCEECKASLVTVLESLVEGWMTRRWKRCIIQTYGV